MSNFHSPLSKKHKQIVAALCATYGFLYLGRVNISVVLPVLAVELDVSRAEIGILGTVFFWTYAIGNFVNGEIGSHVSPKRVVGLGLLVTAIVNLVFGFHASLVVMLVLWGINGIAQSGGWPPIVRILSERLHPSQIKQVSTIIPISYVIGTVVTWTMIGAVAAGGNWRLAFWLPGVILLLAAALWWKAGIDAPTTVSKGVRLSTIIAESRGRRLRHGGSGFDWIRAQWRDHLAAVVYPRQPVDRRQFSGRRRGADASGGDPGPHACSSARRPAPIRCW